MSNDQKAQEMADAFKPLADAAAKVKANLTKPAVADFKSQLAMAYYSGYHAGHNETVEGTFCDVVDSDRYTHFADTINDLIDEGGIELPQAVVLTKDQFVVNFGEFVFVEALCHRIRELWEQYDKRDIRHNPDSLGYLFHALNNLNGVADMDRRQWPEGICGCGQAMYPETPKMIKCSACGSTKRVPEDVYAAPPPQPPAEPGDWPNTFIKLTNEGNILIGREGWFVSTTNSRKTSDALRSELRAHRDADVERATQEHREVIASFIDWLQSIPKQPLTVEVITKANSLLATKAGAK